MTTVSFAELRARLRLPLIAAPMFQVSGPDLVVAACVAGAIGAFPTANCRSTEELDAWLGSMADRLAAAADRTGAPVGPVCANLIVHRSNPRLADDLRVLLDHRARPELVITSVGAPTAVIAPLHEAGTLVFADVATLAHARKAIAA